MIFGVPLLPKVYFVSIVLLFFIVLFTGGKSCHKNDV